VANLHVAQVAVRDELPGEADRLLASLHADDLTRRPNELGENVEAPLRAATNLDHTLTRGDPDAVEEPARFMRKLLRLALQALLLSLSVTKEILICLSHDHSPWCGLMFTPPTGLALSGWPHERSHAVEPVACPSAPTPC
jgi:hypothetical protein